MRDGYIGEKYCLTGTGKYSITQGYKRLTGIEKRWEFANILWNKVAVPKHSSINWLVVQKRLPTKNRMQVMEMTLEDTECKLCNNGTLETVEHLLTNCSGITGIWKEIQTSIGIIVQNKEPEEMLMKIKKKKWLRERKAIVDVAYEVIVYNTLIERNTMIFKKERHEDAFVIQQIKNTIRDKAQIA